MKRIWDFFKDRRVIVVIGLLALSVLIWFGGPYVRFGESAYAPLGSTTARLVTIIVLLSVWGIYNLVAQARQRKQNDGLIEAIDSTPAGGHADDGSAEVRVLGERFHEAMAGLRKLRFRGRGGRKKVVYELPWYIIIGPPGSGKTTALVNSGLEFPLADKFGDAALRGIGGTRNCDWWFTNEAVLLDTAGRYTTQDSHRVVDSAAWKGFLGLLKKNRPRRPINGAIVTFSLQDLLTMSEEERDRHARTIRQRIDELITELGVRFPIYFTFTKVDLVAGFNEFFDNLGRDEREQVWGATFEDVLDEAAPVDIDRFSDEYDALIARLNDRVLWRLNDERDIRRRSRLQGFPQQIEDLKPAVMGFLRQAFSHSRYHVQPYLRGVYFTSGTQDGTPIDRMMSALAENFGFSRDVAASAQSQGRAYFIGRLFRDVIFPEAELVGVNRRLERIMRWGQRAAYAAMLVLAVGLLVAWGTTVTRNKLYLADVSEYVDTYLQASGGRALRSDARAALPPLNALRDAARVYDREEHPWLAGFGLYDASVDVEAKAAYRRALEQRFAPYLQGALEAYLVNGAQDPLDLYQAFRIYMMLDRPEHLEPQAINEWFLGDWERRYARYEDDRRALQAHLNTFLSTDTERLRADDRLVSRTRETLRRIPTSQRIYAQIRSNPDLAREYRLDEFLGTDFTRAFVTSGNGNAMRIPAMFTRDAYKEMDFAGDAPVITDSLESQWVLQEPDEPVEELSEAERERLAERVKAHYLAEYAAQWDEFLKTLEIQRFDGIADGRDKLAVLVDPVHSPLVTVLQLTAENTELSFRPPTQVADAAVAEDGSGMLGRAGGMLSGQFEGNRVDKQFRPINDLMREGKAGAAPITQVIGSIRQVHDYLSQIALAPNSSQAAFTAAKARFQGGADAISQLRQQAAGLPEPLRQWLNTIADESWRVVLGSAKAHINNEWQSQVYNSYRRALAGRYPLHRNADDELAVYDFAEFFKPQGVLDTFADEYLAAFVDRRRGWRARSLDGYSIGLSPGAVTQLRRADTIRQVFFRENPASPAVSFEIKPWRMDDRVSRFELNLGTQQVSYAHGPKLWRGMAWPGGGDASHVRIVFEDLDYRSVSRTYEGPWAWFRALDAAQVQSAGATNVYRVSFNAATGSGGEPYVARFDIRAKSVNNPFGADLLGRFRCPGRL